MGCPYDSDECRRALPGIGGWLDEWEGAPDVKEPDAA